MKIKNQRSYSESEFLDEADIKPYVSVDGVNYVLLGYEDGDCKAPLVAREDGGDELFATPLWEVLKFAQGGKVTYLS